MDHPDDVTCCYTVHMRYCSENQNLLLGVGGGIAAYKSLDLCRRLLAGGYQVRVVMTNAAQAFVKPLSFQALSGHPVRTLLLDEHAEAGMSHIELARWADMIVIAPATANLLARLAHGLADDLLTTLCLASKARLLLAPAMNQQMWRAPATVANVACLEQRGVRILGPAEGELACGDAGPGRMLEPEQIIGCLSEIGLPRPLAGTSVLVTAGPTREAIDPVRYISNHSSGKMGYAVAAAAARAGAKVTLVSGPVNLPAPGEVVRIAVQSAQQMYDEVMARISGQDIFIAAAAVSDYRPAVTAPEKIKKHAASTNLDMVRNPDVLAAVAALAEAPFTVGFAAETENLADNARAKMAGKGLDMIAANQVGVDDRGFDSEQNALSVYWNSGEKMFPLAAKKELGRDLVELIWERYCERHTIKDSGPAPGA